MKIICHDKPYTGPHKCIRGYSMGTDAERAAEGLLTEGLIRTYPVDDTGQIIAKMFYEYLTDLTYDNGQFIVSLVKYTPEIVRDIIERFDRLGWYCSVDDENSDTLTFEAKFQTRYKNTELPSDYKYLYHISPSKHKAKILANGLCPRSKNAFFAYPERIYLIPYNISEQSPYFLAAQLWKNSKTNPSGKYTLYKLDTAKMNNVDFEVDYNYGMTSCEGQLLYGLYTTNNISPSAIVNAAEMAEKYDIDLDKLNMTERFSNRLKK